jgi:rhomboid protease GluP
MINYKEFFTTPWGIIIIVCCLLFLPQLVGIDINSLGWKDNFAIRNGQWYRLITSIFLHGGIVHLLLNMASLYNLAPLSTRLFGMFGQNGNVAFLTIFFVSGLMGSLASYYFSQAYSLGASGAIFGLIGALLAISYFKKLPELYQSILSVTVINLALGFTFPNIDNYAHIGGLVGGFLTACLLIFV